MSGVEILPRQLLVWRSEASGHVTPTRPWTTLGEFDQASTLEPALHCRKRQNLRLATPAYPLVTERLTPTARACSWRSWFDARGAPH
jgi:hypothetical protein